MITGKINDSYGFSISSDCIQFQPIGKVEDLTIRDDAVDAMSNYIINDLKSTQIAVDDLRKYDLYVKGIWNKEEEEKDMENTKLLDIYETKALTNIAERETKECEEVVKNNETVKLFETLTEEFEKALEDIYAHQNFLEPMGGILTNSFTDENVYKYAISKSAIDIITKDVHKKYDEERNKIKSLVSEIKAHIAIIGKTDNCYSDIMAILYANKILNDTGLVVQYTGEDKSNQCEECSCETKRGRKPKKEQ